MVTLTLVRTESSGIHISRPYFSAHFLIFKGHIFYATLMLMNETPKIGLHLMILISVFKQLGSLLMFLGQV